MDQFNFQQSSGINMNKKVKGMTVFNTNEVDTKNTLPVTNPSNIKIPFRKDQINDGKIEEKILKNAPEKKAGYFVVPKVVE